MKKTFYSFAVVLAIVLQSFMGYGQEWDEDWESGMGDWWVTNGTWEVGIPTSGPNSPHGGSNCAATVLDGNYSDYADDSHLATNWFTIPSAPENPRLRFWHWYSFHSINNDYGKVQIRTQSNLTWVSISNTFREGSSSIWANSLIDLMSYADSTVQIGFFFHSEIYGAAVDEGPGWYIDDIELRTGPVIFNNPEDWEYGINDWWVSDGTWEVGTPTSGPGSAHGGSNCAATVMDGNYSDYADNSRLTSPWFTVPSASENPRLRFWHWYSFHSINNDYGKVQIRTQGNSWVDISNEFRGNSSGIWANSLIDLMSYAETTVQIAFWFHSEIYGEAVDEGPGWYIDDIELRTGPVIFNNPEDWENGINDWWVSDGTWEVGAPASGPGSAHGGSNCAATVLDGNYSDYADNSRLTSSWFTVPSASENPRLRFWHWYSFHSINNDYGKVQIRTQGNSWVNFSSNYTGNSSGEWLAPEFSLISYVNTTVQIGFYFHSEIYGTAVDEGLGWYIDDIEIVDNSNLMVDAGPDTTINYGTSATLNATVNGGTPPYVFEWTPIEGLNDPFVLNPVASPSDTTLYTLTVIDDHGCFRTDYVTVNVVDGTGINDINVDNICIYPNPVKNDLFLSAVNGVIINEINIYNQIGQKVLNIKKITNTINVSMLKQGIYFIELVTNDSKITEKFIIR